MIKIYDMETLEEREILFRGGSGADVSAPVAEILRARIMGEGFGLVQVIFQTLDPDRFFEFEE